MANNPSHARIHLLSSTRVVYFTMMFANIAFPISSYQTFTYRISAQFESEITVGQRVLAPLGKRKVTGIIVALSKTSSYQGTVREITDFIDKAPVLDTALWKLLIWMSHYYQAPLGQVAAAAMPSSFSQSYEPPKEFWVRLQKPVLPETLDQLKRKAPVQAAIIESIQNVPDGIPLKQLSSITPQPLTPCRALENKELVTLWRQTRSIFDLADNEILSIPQHITHSDEQVSAIRALSRGLNSKSYHGYLLHGVTGSGKTEVYIEMTRRTLAQGRSALILVPEIALTPQIAGRFRAVFGSKVALWHSGLKPAVRAWTWKKICQGEFQVVIGARSAVLTPIRNPGLIVIDEEHEHTYKQESPAPRYHARDVALIRGRESGAVVLLASATPSLESYYNQIQGKFHYLTLTERVAGARFPRVHVVDMNREQEETGKVGQVLSGALIHAIEDRLKKGEQTILFQNRRGFAPIFRCRDCGHILGCPHCQVALAFHKVGHHLECHVCGYRRKDIPEMCPECSGPNLALQGTGTQKIETLLEESFPGARLARLDFDTSRARGHLTRTLQSFARGDTDILLGTQMIAKGLDFAQATLVGIINADLGLYLPDFRSGERVFQLLYQAAGRSGRGALPGEVIIQTYNPDEPTILHATHLDLKKYYNQLLAERKLLSYPPFSRMARLEMIGKDPARLLPQGQKLHSLLPRMRTVECLGPVECYRHKVRDHFRIQFIFKSSKEKDPRAKSLHGLLNHIQGLLKKEKRHFPGTRFIFDIDPISIL
ncbi:MAG: primosomal protein N' [FCB group bacterium]|nr:primosomal protein N' [FCB group bacterium]